MNSIIIFKLCGVQSSQVHEAIAVVTDQESGRVLPTFLSRALACPP